MKILKKLFTKSFLNGVWGEAPTQPELGAKPQQIYINKST